MTRALVREDRGVQKHVYYVSKSLFDAESIYQRMEKMVLALFIISRKLKYYFQFFSDNCANEHPLRSIVEKLQTTR